VGREFTPADRAYHADGRRAKVKQVTESMRDHDSRQADQSEIWEEIAAKSARLGAHSDTRAAAAMYETRRDSLDDLLQKLEPVDRQVGAVFAIRGAIAGLDAFDSPRTWRGPLSSIEDAWSSSWSPGALPGDGVGWPKGAVRSKCTRFR
jgi:ARG and Rhodanese-Phosphatase-superfamily-associated Protein domain